MLHAAARSRTAPRVSDASRSLLLGAVPGSLTAPNEPWMCPLLVSFGGARQGRSSTAAGGPVQCMFTWSVITIIYCPSTDVRGTLRGSGVVADPLHVVLPQCESAGGKLT